MNAQSRYESFLAHLAQLSMYRRPEPDYGLYEALKGQFVREFPGLTDEQYNAGTRACAKAAGV